MQSIKVMRIPDGRNPQEATEEELAAWTLGQDEAKMYMEEENAKSAKSIPRPNGIAEAAKLFEAPAAM